METGHSYYAVTNNNTKQTFRGISDMITSAQNPDAETIL